MRLELILLAAIVGFATWVFRFAPTKLRVGQSEGAGPVRRFLVATGPAAIATLCAASILPMVNGEIGADLPLILGVAAVLLAYRLKPSVVLATIVGALVYGLASVLI